jgi:uncharacterized protein YfaQ (DUF2300 family)
MRRNMLFGDGLEGVQMTAPGAAPASLADPQLDLREWVRKLAATRTASRALRRGDRRTLLGSDGDLWVYAYVTDANDVAIVVVNRGGDVAGRTVDASSLGVDLGALGTFTSAMGPGELSVSGSALSVSIGAGQATVFLPR